MPKRDEARLPWVKWFPVDWIGDSCVQRAPVDVRGAWNEILQHMLHDRTPQITADMAEWARVIGCSRERAERLIMQIHDRQIANMSRSRNGHVTLACRRLVREQNQRDANALRQKKLRGRDVKGAM